MGAWGGGGEGTRLHGLWNPRDLPNPSSWEQHHLPQAPTMQGLPKLPRFPFQSQQPPPRGGCGGGREGEKQEEKTAKEVEDSDTYSDVSILRWLQGLKLRGDGGQRKGHKDLRPEVVEEEETEEPQRQERMSHTEDHGGPHPPPKVGLEVGEKEEKDEDLRQKEKSKMEGHKQQHSHSGKRRSSKVMGVEHTEKIVTPTVTYQS